MIEPFPQSDTPGRPRPGWALPVSRVTNRQLRENVQTMVRKEPLVYVKIK